MTKHEERAASEAAPATPGEDIDLRAVDAVLAEALGAAPEPAAALHAGKSRLLAAVARPSLRYAPFFGKLFELFDLEPDALTQVFERAELAAEWSPGPLPGIQVLHLDGGSRVAELDSGLVRIEAGLVFPVHRHRGEERVILLEGEYRDSSGRLYGPGDWHTMPTGTEHHFRVSTERDLLLAVVMAAEIEVLGMPPA